MRYLSLENDGLAAKVGSEMQEIRLAGINYFSEHEVWPASASAGVVPLELEPLLSGATQFDHAQLHPRVGQPGRRSHRGHRARIAPGTGAEAGAAAGLWKSVRALRQRRHVHHQGARRVDVASDSSSTSPPPGTFTAPAIESPSEPGRAVSRTRRHSPSGNCCCTPRAPPFSASSRRTSSPSRSILPRRSAAAPRACCVPGRSSTPPS